MKRLYTIMLSGLVLAASAVAAVPTAVRHIGKARSVKAIELTETSMVQTLPITRLTGIRTSTKVTNKQINKRAQSSANTFAQINAEIAKLKNNNAQKAPRKTEDFSTYTWTEKGDGVYAASVIAEVYGASAEPVNVKVFEADGHAGIYKLVGVWPDLVSGGCELIVDASDPEFVTIPDQYTGIMDDVDGETHIFSLSALYDKETVIEYLPDFNLTLKENVIEIPIQALVINWPNAPEDSEYGTTPETLYFNSDFGTIVLPGGTYVAPWTLVTDKAQFTENIMYPYLVGEENTTATTHHLYQQTSKPSVYKLVSPLKSVYNAISLSGESPYMLLDTTDPENVMIASTSSGISGSTDGTYFYSSESYETQWSSNPLGDEFKIKFAAQDDGSTKITFPVKSMRVTPYNTNVPSTIEYASELVFTVNDIDEPETPIENYTWNSLGQGKYKGSSLATMYGGTTDFVDVEVFEANEKAGVYKFVGVWPDLVDNGTIIVDASDPDFVIVPEQNTGIIDNVDGITYIMGQATKLLARFDKETIINALPGIIVTMTDGIITFPYESIVLRWPEAPEDSSYGTNPESWYLSGETDGGLALLPGAEYVEPDPNEGWTSIGDATFQDGWVLPFFGIDQTNPDNFYKVELQQNDDNENVYRLVNPYQGDAPVNEVNVCVKPGYIQFDITDPDHVVFATNVASGFAYSDEDFSLPAMYCYNTFSYYMAYYGLSIEQVASVLDQQEGYQYSTYKDGIVTVPSWTDENGTLLNDVCFSNSSTLNLYYWSDENGIAANMETKIFFPGVDSIREINAKSEAASDVYYNLHGQRISKPTVPGIYIRNNSKVIVH